MQAQAPRHEEMGRTRGVGGVLAGMGAAVLALHALGWGGFLLAAAQGGGILTVGIALAAYTLGMRHAFDADHIAAIDNATRRLRAMGQRPLSVGFWFSLGHSTVVFALAVGVVFAARGVYSAIEQPGSLLHSVGGLLGTLVSAGFLFVIASVNLGSLWTTVRRARAGETRPVGDLLPQGPLFRLFGRVVGRIRRPSGMYPVGLLFGLGFDTATEVALLAATAGEATTGIPWYGVLALPCLFAAGMSVCDSLDGVGMHYAYDWSLKEPGRRFVWNVAITALSATVALGVGLLEVLSLVPRTAAPGVLGPFAGVDLSGLGLGVVALLFGTWFVALLVWRAKGVAGRDAKRAC